MMVEMQGPTVQPTYKFISIFIHSVLVSEIKDTLVIYFLDRTLEYMVYSNRHKWSVWQYLGDFDCCLIH